MEVWLILHKLRDGDRLRNFKNNFRKLQQMISVLGRASPFIGRILTRGKFYAGKIEKLAMKDGQLEFTIIDCDGKGKTNGNSKIYKKRIAWEDLRDIQVLKDKKGKTLWLENLFRDQKPEDKNE